MKHANRTMGAKMCSFVFFLLFCLSGLGPLAAQESESDNVLVPKLNPLIEVKGFDSDLNLSVEEKNLIQQLRKAKAEKEAELSERAREIAEETVKDIEATKPGQKKPQRTVGDVLGKMVAPEAKSQEAEAKGVAEEEIPPGQKLHFKDEKKSGERFDSEQQIGESTFFDKLVTVTWSLAFISLLIWVFAKLAGKAGFKQIGAMVDKKSLIEVIEKKRLSPGRSIIIMRVGPKILAVAATEGGYKTLTEFDQDEFQTFSEDLDLKKKIAEAEPPPDGVTTPADIARHYLSILPGTGAKK